MGEDNISEHILAIAVKWGRGRGKIGCKLTGGVTMAR